MKRLITVAALLALAAFVFAQERFLVVTPAGTPESVKAALDATASLPGGTGFSGSGTVAALDDEGAAAAEFHGSHLTTIWPAAGAAPYAWYVTPEDDAGTFQLTFGPSITTLASDHAQRLLIDGVLHRIGSAQVPGVRPSSSLTVALQRSEPAVTRTVELPTPSKARVTRARPPVGAIVLASRSALRPRELADSVVVWDNSEDEYRVMPIRDLLRDIYTEPDAVRRYVATKVAAARPTTFTEAELLAGATAEGLATGIAMPATPMGAERVWVGVAMEAGTAFPYFALQATNAGFNERAQRFSADPDDTVQIAGVDYDLYVALRDSAAVFTGTGFHAYFDRDSVNP